MVLNYLYADVLGQFDPAVVGYIEAGEIDGMTIDSGFLLGAGVLMQLPIWMVLLSRWLPMRANRWVNMAAAVFSAVVIVASNFIGANEAYYVLYSAAELVGAGAIVAIAYRGGTGERR